MASSYVEKALSTTIQWWCTGTLVRILVLNAAKLEIAQVAISNIYRVLGHFVATYKYSFPFSFLNECNKEENKEEKRWVCFMFSSFFLVSSPFLPFSLSIFFFLCSICDKEHFETIWRKTLGKKIVQSFQSSTFYLSLVVDLGSRLISSLDSPSSRN